MTDYAKIATRVRKKVLELLYNAQASHVGSNLSCIDILTVLYATVAKVDKYLREDRDRIIFSKGLAAAAAYTFLAEKGILSYEELSTYCKPDSSLIGLVERSVRGIEASTGSMGHGLPIGVGMALGAKRGGQTWSTYVLMSDGEMDCGTTWESALLAAHHKLDNLVVIIDVNKWQATGKTADILNTEPLGDKWRVFGWEVKHCDGHDYKAIESALTEDREHKGKPLVVITKTIKGRGVSFMEDKLEWHYRSIDEASYKKACEELL